jgi:hypothetical protein
MLAAQRLRALVDKSSYPREPSIAIPDVWLSLYRVVLDAANSFSYDKFTTKEYENGETWSPA